MEKDFIGVYENVLDESCINQYFHYWNDMECCGEIMPRTRPSHETKDKSLVIIPSSGSDNYIVRGTSSINVRNIATSFIDRFWLYYHQYAQTYSILSQHEKHNIFYVKMQKTSPGEGYHIWHSETLGRNESNRILAFTYYLNDVEEGGETEFLYYPRRIKPVKNTLVIFPAAFTHTHRGNQPLSGEKFILTGWVEF